MDDVAADFYVWTGECEPFYFAVVLMFQGGTVWMRFDGSVVVNYSYSSPAAKGVASSQWLALQSSSGER